MTADPPTVRVSLFDDVQDVVPKETILTWVEVVAGLSRSEERPAKGGRLWSPCTYRERHRKISNAEAITLVVLDVDDGSDPLRVRDHLASLGLAHVIYSTYNSNAAHPKYRVSVPIAHPIPAGDWPLVRRGLYHLLAPTAVVDPATVDSTRMFYFPQHPPGSTPFLYVGEGAALDPDTVPRSAPAPEAGGIAVPDYKPAIADEPDEATVELARRAVDSGMLNECYGRRLRLPVRFTLTGKDGGRMHVMGRLAKELRREGFDAREILAILYAVNDRWNDPPHPDVSHVRRWRDSVMRTIPVPAATASPSTSGAAGGGWQDGARDVYWSIAPGGYMAARCPADGKDDVQCGAVVYENRRENGGAVGRGDMPLVIPVGDPDRAGDGEDWRTAHTLCSTAGVFREPTYLYSLEVPVGTDRPRTSPDHARAVTTTVDIVRRLHERFSERTSWVAELGRGVCVLRHDHACDEDGTRVYRQEWARDAGGIHVAAISETAVRLIVVTNLGPPRFLEEFNVPEHTPGRLPLGFVHFATIAPCEADGFRAHLEKILACIRARRPAAAEWFHSLVAEAAEVRGLHLMAPWGTGLALRNRVNLLEEKTDHVEHFCPFGALVHADGDAHVYGPVMGGPALTIVGARPGLTPTEAAEIAWDGYLEALTGRLPRDDIDAYVTSAPNLPAHVREIWALVRDRPPPSYLRRSRGRSPA